MRVVPFSEEAVRIVTYPSADFSQDLSKFLRGKSLDLNDPLIAKILPYCVFVENQTDHGLSGLVARYDFETPRGNRAHVTLFLLNQNSNRPEQNFAAGDVSLIAPIPNLASSIQGAGGPQSWSANGRSFIENEVAKFVRNQDISLSIDSIIDENGHLVGPDRAQTVLRLNAKSDAEQQLINQVETTLSLAGVPAALSQLRTVASGEPDEAGDPELALDKRRLFYQKAQIQFARLLLTASNGGVSLPDVLNRFGSMQRLHITRKAEPK